MKMCYWSSLLVVWLLAAAGCSDSESNHHGTKNEVRSGPVAEAQEQSSQNLGPEEILLKYLNAGIKAGIKGKSRETYRLLSSKDKEVSSEEEYLSNSSRNEPLVSHELMSVMTQKISYVIRNSAIDNSAAKIEVEKLVPRLPSSVRSSLLENNYSETEKKVITYLQSPELQFDTSVESYKLVKEPNGWRVFLDLAKTMKINSLIEEAEILVPSLEMLGPIDGSVLESMKSKLLLAQEKYKEALSLGDDFRAKNNLEYLEKQIDKLAFYERQKGLIQIKDVKVGESRYGGKGVFGEVKNNGDVALTKVAVHGDTSDRRNLVSGEYLE